MSRPVDEQTVKALSSDHAQELYYCGWTLDEIKNRVCVDCGKIDMVTFGLGEAFMPGGRKRETHQNGRQCDAGHICGVCISTPSTKEGQADGD